MAESLTKDQLPRVTLAVAMVGLSGAWNAGYARAPGRCEGVLHPPNDHLAVGDLPHDPDLHVVDEERQPAWVARVLERPRNVEPVHPLHGPKSTAGPSARRRTATGAGR